MAKIEMNQLIEQGLDRAVELMALAAHNSFRFDKKNTLKMIAVGKEEMQEIAEFCFSLGDMSPLGARDGRFVMELIKEPCSLLIIGDKRKSVFKYNCGACGYRTCAELNAAEEVESLTANGPSCQFKNMNMNIAANAAAAMAWRLGLHCRVFSTLGFAAKAMEVIEDVDLCVAVSVSAAREDPYFDRHKYWTKEYWDEIFNKEFPTFSRGFIGAVEDQRRKGEIMSKAHLNQVIASHLVEIKAEEMPDQEIFIFERGEHGEDILTYKDLHENSNKLARLLLQNGVGKGDTFAVFMRNYPEFAYSLLAGTTIGAIMVPVDPRSRGDRLKFLLNNSGAKAVIASCECFAALDEVVDDLKGVKFVTAAYQRDQDVPVNSKYHILDKTLEEDSWEKVDQRIFDVRHPMQIIYTSGTTGDPKGVMIRNNRTGIFNILRQIVWKYKKSDILYNGLSLTHGNAQAVTFFPAMYMGIKAVFSPRFTKSRIWDICRKYGCTSFSLLGGMAAGIHNEPERPDDRDNPVNMVISAGTPASIWEAFEERFNVKILEWYGAVEGGFAYKPPEKGPVGSFGKPVPGIMEFKVVDENDNEVPPGVTGELISRMIKGETKVDYLGLPDASDEKTKGGWLRSGDMVHRDEKGWYFFDYRKGAELRRAGDFIQPDHVEMVVGRHPDVSDACVYGIPAASGAPGESDLVAAVAPFRGKTIDPTSVYELCRNELEANFIPSFLQVVEELPKSISEKALDRVLKGKFSPDSENVHKFEDYK